MTISMIVAMDEEFGIGKGNRIPWTDTEDLVRFKALTETHIVIMGRKTYASLGKFNRPLRNRTNFVVTSSAFNVFSLTGVFDLTSLLVCFYCPEAALLEAKQRALDTFQEIWIIGGATIYEKLLPYVDDLYITHVEGKHDCDTFFPEFRPLFKLEEIEDQIYGTSVYTRYRRIKHDCTSDSGS